MTTYLTPDQRDHIWERHGRFLTTNADTRRDPTRTTKLRARYAADMYGRFNPIKKLTRVTLVDNDALRLKGGGGLVSVFQAHGRAKPAERFVFSTDAGRVQAFMEWLQEVVNLDVLEVVDAAGNPITDPTRWQDAYVREAYGRGVAAADAALAREGVEIPGNMQGVFSRPFHRNSLELLYTRNFTALKGITEAMQTQIARTLADGLTRGLPNDEIAKLLNGRVQSIGIVRAKILARTEIINVLAESTLNRMDEMDIPAVTPQVEFATAGNPCPICQELSGRVYTIAEARGVIPAHINCRCAWLPVLNI